MKKEDRQIKWDSFYGYYKNQLLFFIAEGSHKFYLYFLANGREVMAMDYTTRKSAKRGAERFLRRLQKVVKLDKKEPKTCDDCWLQRDFGNYIPAGYCADKCAKIYNALKVLEEKK